MEFEAVDNHRKMTVRVLHGLVFEDALNLVLSDKNIGEKRVCGEDWRQADIKEDGYAENQHLNIAKRNICK
jgi:hypothetical protein